MAQSSDMLDSILRRNYLSSQQAARPNTSLPSTRQESQPTTALVGPVAQPAPNRVPQWVRPRASIVSTMYQQRSQNTILTVPLPPGMDEFLLSNGVKPEIVDTFRKLGIPKELLDQLPMPNNDGNPEAQIAQATNWFQPAQWGANLLETISKPLIWVNNTVDKPFASLAVLGAQSLMPGEQGAEKAFREGGYDDLRAYYDSEALPEWAKFGIEMANPVWWIPLSVWAKPVQIGTKALIGAKAAEAITAKSGMLTSKISTPLIKKLEDLPYTRGLMRESPLSIVKNLPSTTTDAINDMKGVYAKAGKSELDMLDDLAHGNTLNFGRDITLKDTLSPERAKAYNILLNKEITVGKGKSARTIDISKALDYDSILTMAKGSKDTPGDTFQAWNALTGRLYKTAQSAYGIDRTRIGEHFLADVYQWWRAAVLATPNYVVQQLVENPIRTLTYTRRLPLFGSQVAELAAREGVPVRFRNMAISAENYIKHGSYDAVQAKLRIQADLEIVGKELESLKVLGKPTIHTEAKIAKLNAELAALPQSAGSLISPVMVTGEVIGTPAFRRMTAEELSLYGGRVPNAYERSLVFMFGHGFMRKPTAFAARFPYSVANYMDAMAYLRIYEHNMYKGVPISLSTSIAGAEKIKFVDSVFNPDDSSKWATSGADKSIQDYTRDVALRSKNQDELTQGLAAGFADAYPALTSKIDIESTLPEGIKSSLRSPLYGSVAEKNIPSIKDTIARTRKNLITYQKDVTDQFYKDQAIVNKAARDAMSIKARTLMDSMLARLDMDEEFTTTFDEFKALLTDIAPEDKLGAEALYWAKLETNRERSRIVINQILSQANLEAAVTNEEEFVAIWEKVEHMSKILKDNFRKPRVGFAVAVRQLPTKGHISESKWAEFVAQIAKIDPEFAIGAMDVPHTRSSAWMQLYYPKTAERQSRWPEAMAEAFGIDKSMLPTARFDEQIKAFNQQLDDIETEAIRHTYGRVAIDKELLPFAPQINTWMDYLPPEIRSKLTRVRGYAGREDEFGTIGKSAGTGKYDEILLNTTMLGKQTDATLAHELAHIIDNPVGVAGIRLGKLTRSEEWLDLIRGSDYAPEVMSGYAMKLWPSEELAWRVEQFLYTPEKLLAESPGKYAFIAKHFKAIKPSAFLWEDRATALMDMSTKLFKAFKDHEDVVMSSIKEVNMANQLAEDAAYAVMGNYARTRNIDELIRPIFPFFYFPTRSIPFYLRTGIEYPITMRGMALYQEHTKEPGKPQALYGYMKVPGSINGANVYVNPLRPWAAMQIFGEEPLAGINQPVMDQITTSLGMMGLSLTPIITLPMEIASRVAEQATGYQLTKGEPRPLIPQLDWATKAMSAATALPIPEPTQLAFGLDTMPAWKRREIEKELASMGVNPEGAFSHNSTKEQQQAISVAIRNIGFRDISKIIAPVKFRHDSEIAMLQDQVAILEQYGITKGMQDKFREDGISPMQYLNNMQKRQIYRTHPEWEPWTGLTNPFLSVKEKQWWDDTQDFWQQYNTTKDQYDKEQMEDTGNLLLGQLSRGQWRDNYSKRQEMKASLWKALSDWYANSRKPGQPKALIDNKTRDEYRLTFGRSLPPIHIEDIAVQAYYTIEATLDPITRQPDYEELQLRQDDFLDSLPFETAEYIRATLTQPKLWGDPVEQEWLKDRRKLRNWYGVRYELFRLHPEWEQLSKQLDYYETADPYIAKSIKSSRMYKAYSNTLSKAREQLRKSDAELEYILLKWGISGISNTLNPMTTQFILAERSKQQIAMAKSIGVDPAKVYR